MANEDMSRRKCFTFIWKLENVSYCWQSHYDCIESPSFTVDEIFDTNWNLRLFPSYGRDSYIRLFLVRNIHGIFETIVNIYYELAFLSSNGTVLRAFRSKMEFLQGNFDGTEYFILRNEVFLTRRSTFLPQDTLTVRCRMWNSIDEMSKDVQCFARTCIVVEKRTCLYVIENFSKIGLHGKNTYAIKSRDNSKKLMSLEFFLTGGQICDETIHFRIIPDYQNLKIFTFQLSVVDAFKNTVKLFRDEFWCGELCGSKEFTLFRTRNELMKNESEYLPNDVLTLLCECTFSFGTLQEELDMIDSACIGVAEKESNNRGLGTENDFSASKCILLDHLKSMLNNSSKPDVKLKTNSHIHPAHKSILSARSPVFKAMFSNDMKEKINECVDIEDLNDDTVLRLLRYIYSAEVEELEWISASELYVAADKYQILSLKVICSSYLKGNLCATNACDALILADMYQDVNLKDVVQDFILRHGEEIINSEEWKQIAETNLKLAYETVSLKFKK